MTFTLRVQTEVRSLARRLGLISVLSRVRAVLPRPASDKYEARFRSMLEQSIRAGDVVWDVGANVGLYTELFARRVGDGGIVCAFEPAPACFEALRRCVGSFAQARLFNFALGSHDGMLPFTLAPDPLAATHSFASATGSFQVRVARADSLVGGGEAAAPAVLKIDVEGFEEEVLDGASEVLRRQTVRAVFLEVHFGILEGRGRRHAPASIVEKLRAHGFSTRWIDPSHLAATR